MDNNLENASLSRDERPFDGLRLMRVFVLWASLVLLSLLAVLSLLVLLLEVLSLLVVILGGGTSIGLLNQLLVLQRQWGRSGQMISGGTESVLISNILDGVFLAIVTVEGVVSLSHNSLLVLLTFVLHLTVLCHLNSVGRLESETVTVLILFGLVLYDGNELLLSLRLIASLLLVFTVLAASGISQGDDDKGG